MGLFNRHMSADARLEVEFCFFLGMLPGWVETTTTQVGTLVDPTVRQLPQIEPRGLVKTEPSQQNWHGMRLVPLEKWHGSMPGFLRQVLRLSPARWSQLNRMPGGAAGTKLSAAASVASRCRLCDGSKGVKNDWGFSE